MIRILSMIASFIFATSAFAMGNIDYKPGVIQSLLKDGKTVFVDYKASWCTTCAAQERVISELRSQNPAYDKSLTFVTVDWDQYSKDEVTTSRNVPRRSTLLVLMGDKELGRVVASTSKDEIKALLDTGVDMAMMKMDAQPMSKDGKMMEKHDSMKMDKGDMMHKADTMTSKPKSDM